MITNKQKVATVKKVCPKHNKYLHSHANNPDSGVCLSPTAKAAIRKEYGPAALGPSISSKKANRKNPMRITCRFTESEMERLQQAQIASGRQTMQDYVHEIIMNDVKDYETTILKHHTPHRAAI